ncbi:MAG: hypothetical protein A3F40_01915, partial [Chlamydiae bacterium RIFCSPHIGHO2_12_FULL_27_8]
KNKKVKIFSRNKNILNKKFKILAQEFSKIKKNCILDGEIVAFDKGKTSFSKLQRVLKNKTKVYFYAFDLLYLNDKDLRDESLIDRKKILKEKFVFTNLFRYTKHIEKEGEKFFKKACKKGLEGIIAKKKDSKYFSKRTKDWLKFKCHLGQELIIIGFTKPKKTRIGFGALHLGYFDKNILKYAGKVGTGFDFDFLKSFSKKLKKIKTKKNYFENLKDTEFVKLKYVAQIDFTEWTRDKKLRHPRFLGLRDDKNPKKVVKE